MQDKLDKIAAETARSCIFDRSGLIAGKAFI
jgi:hypothetical protein